MKALQDYIIERFKISNDIKNSFAVDISKFDSEDLTMHKDTVWRTLEMPKQEWIIAKDYYRNSLMHFFCAGDFLLSFGWFQDDYEDFDPNKDILYASDDFDDAFNWYLKKLGYNRQELDKIQDYEDLELEFDDSYDKCADSAEFFAKVISGKWTEKDCKVENMPWDEVEKDSTKFFSAVGY